MQANRENTDCPGPMSEADKQAIKAIPASMFEPKRTTIADGVAAKPKLSVGPWNGKRFCGGTSKGDSDERRE